MAADLYLWTETTTYGSDSVTAIKYQTGSQNNNNLAGVCFKVNIVSGIFPTVEDTGNVYQLSDCVDQAKQGTNFPGAAADIYREGESGNKWGLCSGNATSRIITLAGVTGLQSSVNGTNILAYLYGGHYSIESILSASDSDAKSYAAESLTFQVGNPYPNSAPTDITFTAVSNLTTDHIGSIGTLATSDSDLGDTHTYTVSAADDGDGSAPPFEIKNTIEVHVISGVLLTAATYSFKITTSDGNGGTYSEDFSVTISAAITNASPTDITFSAVSDLKTDHAGSIGTLSTTDADGDDTHTYSVTSTGGAAHATLEIQNTSEVHVKSGVTIEAQEYTFKITTDDGNGGTFSKNFTVTFSSAGGGGGGEVTQTITVPAESWDWISFSVEITELADIVVESGSADLDIIKTKDYFATHYGEYNVGYGWFPADISADLNIGQMFQYKNLSTEEKVLKVTGSVPSSFELVIEGPDVWSWVGFCKLDGDEDIGQVFTGSGYAANTIIKKLTSYVEGEATFTTFYEGYGWFPSAFKLRNGEGYQIKNMGSDITINL